MLVFVFFCLGAIFASFIGVLVSRVNTGARIASDRSRCDSCGETLTGVDLIPIVSWLVFKGRCRECGSKIPAELFIGELVLGVLFVAAYYKLGVSYELLLFCIALCLLLAIVLYDLRHQIIPDVFLWPFVALSVLLALLGPGDLLKTTFLTALVLGGSLALIHFLTGGKGMGLADAPLAFGLALLSGSSALAGFIFSFWIGAVVGIIILARRQKGHRMGVEVPFAPFLVAGFLLAFFSGWDPFALISSSLLLAFPV